MSRMQNILEKAEREGTLRHVDAGLEAAATVAAVPAWAATPAAAAALHSAIAPDPGAPAVAADVADIGAVRPIRLVQPERLGSELVAALAPDGAAAEQYRALRTRVLHADNGTVVGILLITSPGRGEGKSVTAVNLALAMAQEPQQRIVLVDANLRVPRVHDLLGIPRGPGLADVLVGRSTLDDALVGIEEHALTVLPAGDHAAHPAELLCTTTMRRALETLRQRFDRIVIDAPAALPLADVGILTPLVDNVVLVVRAGVTSKPAIQEALGSIDRDKLLGTVLNEATG